MEDLPSAELQPWFLRLQWRTCLWAELSDYLYMEFSGTSTPKSLFPVMKWFSWLWWVSDIRGWMVPKFSRNLCYSWGKPRKNLNQVNWPDQGSILGPLGERQRCYSSITAVVACLGNLVTIFRRFRVNSLPASIMTLSVTWTKRKLPEANTCSHFGPLTHFFIFCQQHVIASQIKRF